MNSNQKQRIMQVSEKTLIVGVDIAKGTMWLVLRISGELS